MASESKELINLAKLVLRMRDAQRESHRTGLFSALEVMIHAEVEVDNAIAAIFGDQLTKRAT